MPMVLVLTGHAVITETAGETRSLFVSIIS